MNSTCACELACCRQLYLAHCCLVQSLVAVWGPAPCLQGSQIKHPSRGMQGPGEMLGNLAPAQDLFEQVCRSVSASAGQKACSPAQPEPCSLRKGLHLVNRVFGPLPSLFAKIDLSEASPLLPDISTLLGGPIRVCTWTLQLTSTQRWGTPSFWRNSAAGKSWQ